VVALLAVEAGGDGAHPAAVRPPGADAVTAFTAPVAAAEAAGFALVAPTLHVTVTEPFHLATQLAALDHASLGRAGWVVGADNRAAAYATIGGVPLSPPELRREIADIIDVARQLWDS
jgi:alkanesulfonate monooxygenase SsuD/methylene tetrahydromethanopterin reductase-like flavin-dependent oxidoreductase (luciferase family)